MSEHKLPKPMKTRNPQDEEWRSLTPDQRNEQRDRDDTVGIPTMWIAGIAAVIAMIAMICVVYSNYRQQPSHDHPDQLSAEYGFGR